MNSRQPPRRGRGPSARGKEIIALREANMKQAAIAARLGVSLGAVKQTLRRHRRRRLSGYGYSAEPIVANMAALDLQVGP